MTQTPGQSPEPHKARSPFAQPAFVASATAVAVIAAMGWFVALSGDDEDGRNSSAAARPAVSAPAPDRAGGKAAPWDHGAGRSFDGCPRPADTSQSTSDLEFPLGDMSYRDFGPRRLPVSRTAGPAEFDGDAARCYARTPRGAAMALANLWLRSSYGPDWRSVLSQQVYRDDNRAIHEQKIAAERSGQKGDYGYADADAVGFRLAAYSRDAAMVQLLLRLDSGPYASLTRSMVWEKGDWLMKAPLPQGGDVALVVDPGGYTLFPAAG